ncbi:hypothetical protein NIIDMKKI_78130 [Mycobacterium kansasii]|uniref:PABS domain-containing protein n=1 Tax=Mycobacterium kansasii TaxID=1768 RepID=A0A7G1IP36_MYCKA|nr:hypothetical protein NIIDMKKI_78130 [Mycobacterium kansasii]
MNGTGPGAARAIVEELAPGLSRHWQVDEVICDVRTEFQELVIGRTAQGVALFSGGERQSTEFSQLVYHEALLVPAMLLADKIERVLVISSGEGVVSQLAVAAGATHVDHVDIDRDAVRLCAEHLPYGYTVSELHRAESGLGPITVHYRDGWEFVERSTQAYDIVVVDLPTRVACQLSTTVCTTPISCGCAGLSVGLSFPRPAAQPCGATTRYAGRGGAFMKPFVR